uniref:Uncharacterized protein n=1 Tax=Romanomermis culicivorax TaxID=13658 RepID=A0A915J9E7_ROMCU
MFVICQKRLASSYRKTRKIASRILKGAWLIERGVAAVAEEGRISLAFLMEAAYHARESIC